MTEVLYETDDGCYQLAVITGASGDFEHMLLRTPDGMISVDNLDLLAQLSTAIRRYLAKAEQSGGR